MVVFLYSIQLVYFKFCLTNHNGYRTCHFDIVMLVKLNGKTASVQSIE